MGNKIAQNRPKTISALVRSQHVKQNSPKLTQNNISSASNDRFGDHLKWRITAPDLPHLSRLFLSYNCQSSLEKMHSACAMWRALLAYVMNRFCPGTWVSARDAKVNQIERSYNKMFFFKKKEIENNHYTIIQKKIEKRQYSF